MKLPVQPEKYDRNFEQQRSGIIERAIDSASQGVHPTVAIVDGSLVPSAVLGRAIIFVDDSDGDLKVIFGDGTVKTIVTDT